MKYTKTRTTHHAVNQRKTMRGEKFINTIDNLERVTKPYLRILNFSFVAVRTMIHQRRNHGPVVNLPQVVGLPESFQDPTGN